MASLAQRPSSEPSAYLLQIRQKRLYSSILALLFVLLFASGWQVAQERNAGDFLAGLSMHGAFPAEVLSEAWANRGNLPALWARFLPSLIETINIAAVATLFGALVAMALALLSTNGLALWPRLIPLFRRMMDGARAIPEIVVALVLIFILGGGPLAAMIAIALHTAGALGKLFSEVCENADLKPVEGLASVGASWLARMVFGVVVQVAPNWLSYGLLRFEINLRASAILGFVGEGGIGHDLKLAMQWGHGRYDQVVAIFLLLFAAIVLIDQLSDHFRLRLTKGRVEKVSQ